MGTPGCKNTISLAGMLVLGATLCACGDGTRESLDSAPEFIAGRSVPVSATAAPVPATVIAALPSAEFVSGPPANTANDRATRAPAGSGQTLLPAVMPAATQPYVGTSDIPQWGVPCRSGALPLTLSAAGSWSTYTDINGSVSIQPVSGCGGPGLATRFSFNLGSGEWVVAASNDSFAAPLDLTGYTHLWVPFRGTAGLPVALEIKLRDINGALAVVRLNGGTGLPVWRSWAVDLRQFVPQVGVPDFSAITALEVAFSWPLSGGGARAGNVDIADLSAWRLADERPEVSEFEPVTRNAAAMAAIATDLLARQRPHGFLPAWFELAPNWHLYANALALIVFALEYERLDENGAAGAAAYLEAAYLLADRLVNLQQLSARNGAWDDSFLEAGNTLVLRPEGSRIVWVGSTAWAGIALVIARDLLPDGARYDNAVSAAAQYYAYEQSCRTTAGLPAGSVTEGTEGNISSHLFVAAAAARGLTGNAAPDALAGFIAANLFDPVQQRFFCGVSVDFGSGYDSGSCTLGGSGAIVGVDANSCLDVTGNWGVEWLKRQGRVDDALLGLAYSRLVFPTHAFGDVAVHGLGDIAGPWTPTVEHGAGQWAAAGGRDANYVLDAAWQHLCHDGACQGAADNFSAGIGWNTTSTGISPAAWMYLGWHGGFWSRL